MCEKIGNMNLFSSAVSIFDRSLRVVNNDVIKNINCLAAGSLLLSSFINRFNIVSSRTYVAMMLNTLVCISKSHALMYMYHIGEMLGWRLWEKPVHIIVLEKNEKCANHPDLSEYIRDAFLKPLDGYTQEEIADYVIEMIGYGVLGNKDTRLCSSV